MSSERATDFRTRVASWLRGLPPWILPVVSSRVLLFLSVAVGLIAWPVREAPFGVRSLGTPSKISAFPDWVWLDGWVRWDSAWYFSVAKSGYYFDPGIESNVAFFPLYPLVVRAVSAPFSLMLDEPRAFYAAAIVVSLVAFFVGAKYLHALSEKILDPQAAARVSWFFCLAPWSLFFGAAYSESLYFALAVCAISEAIDRRFVRASIFAALAALCRSVGLVVAVAVALEFFLRRPFSARPKEVLALSLPVVALLSHMAYLGVVVGDPVAFLHVQDAPLWGRTPGLPPILDTLALVDDESIPLDTRVALSLAPLGVLATLLLSLVAFARVRPSLGLFGVLSMATVLSAGSWDSTGRYTCVVFPAFLALAALVRRSMIVALISSVSTLLLLYNAFGFSHWRQPF